jgi:hypothetical protein
MAKVIVALTVSLDGFVAGPNDGAEDPLGNGGGSCQLPGADDSGAPMLASVRTADRVCLWWCWSRTLVRGDGLRPPRSVS